ncbi:MAG TPA: hypothetical protein VMH28_32500 [Candidatus Acidoferrales bacterium]|nr:hypothetical protein [Candidatus Acidoferrales bacterium]
MRRVLLLSVLLFLSRIAANAGIVYDNGAPDTTTPCSPGCPELTTATGQGIFTLLSNTTLTSARFWTFQSDNVYNGGTFRWQIAPDNGGLTGPLIASGTFAFTASAPQVPVGPVSVFGLTLTEYQNDFTIPSVVINPSPSPQDYFLNITDISGGVDHFGIFWATSGQSTLAFQLSGTGNASPTTPEPASVLLWASGAAACLATRYVRRDSRT